VVHFVFFHAICMIMRYIINVRILRQAQDERRENVFPVRGEPVEPYELK